RNFAIASSYVVACPFVLLGIAGTIDVTDQNQRSSGGVPRSASLVDAAHRSCHRRARHNPRPTTGRRGGRRVPAHVWRGLVRPRKRKKDGKPRASTVFDHMRAVTEGDGLAGPALQATW